MVSCLALIGCSPTTCTRLPTYTHSPYHRPASDGHSAWRSKDADPRLFRARSLRNIIHDVIHSLHKGRSCQSLRRKIQTIWVFGLRWLFGDYHFLVLQLATSLKMAVSTRAEKSPALPPYQSPRRHDSKNTTFHIPAFDSIFAAFFRAPPNSFTINY